MTHVRTESTMRHVDDLLSMDFRRIHQDTQCSTTRRVSDATAVSNTLSQEKRLDTSSTSQGALSGRPKIMAQHHQIILKSRYVHFSKVLQVREVQHRNDMNPVELDERWAAGPSGFSRNMFLDVHSDSMRRYKESETKKRRRREAYMVRRKVLTDIADCRRKGMDDLSVVANNYSRNSARSAHDAHVAALKHAHDVHDEEDRCPTTRVVSSDNSGHRKRVVASQSLAAVKRLRSSCN